MIADRADSVAQNVVVTVIHNNNTLELIMGKTRIDAPVMLLDFDRRSMVGYSWFAGKRLPCPYDSEAGFVKCLAEPGRRLNQKPAITPTGDAETIALAENKAAYTPVSLIPCGLRREAYLHVRFNDEGCGATQHPDFLQDRYI